MTDFDHSLLHTPSALQPYYDAISQIIKTFNEEQNKAYDCKTELPYSPKHKPIYRRTPRHLFINIITCNIEIISSTVPTIVEAKLFTPFGKVELGINVPSSPQERHPAITNFLKNMDWDIVNVTDIVKEYNYNKLHPRERIVDDTDDIKNTIYLVTRVSSIQLVPKENDINKLDLVYYPVLIAEKDQLENDEQLFKIVSNGKNCF